MASLEELYEHSAKATEHANTSEQPDLRDRNLSLGETEWEAPRAQTEVCAGVVSGKSQGTAGDAALATGRAHF